MQPYISAKGRIVTDFANLRVQLAARSQGEQSMESELQSLAKSKQAEMERTIDLREQGYRHRSFTVVNTNEGKGYMDEFSRVAASLSSAESRDFQRIDNEKTVAMKKVLSVTIIANSVLLVFAAGLFGLIRYHERLLAEEVVQSGEELALRDSQLAKLTSALSGKARFNITALNTNSRLLLENYGGFLPRQGHEYAEQMKEAATEMERLRLDLVGDEAPESAAA